MAPLNVINGDPNVGSSWTSKNYTPWGKILLLTSSYGITDSSKKVYIFFNLALKKLFLKRWIKKKASLFTTTTTGTSTTKTTTNAQTSKTTTKTTSRLTTSKTTLITTQTQTTSTNNGRFFFLILSFTLALVQLYVRSSLS